MALLDGLSKLLRGGGRRPPASAQDAPVQYNQTDEYEPAPQSEDERRLVGQIKDWIQQDARAREPWEAPWKQSYEFVMGKQWPNDMEDWRATPVENYMLSGLQNVVARLTANRPTFQVLPENEIPATDPSDPVEVLQHQIGRFWVKQGMDRVVEVSTINQLEFGKGIYYTWWDPEKESPCTRPVDPQNLFVNREATCFEDATRIIHFMTLPTSVLLQAFPEARGKIRGGLETGQPLAPYKDEPQVGGNDQTVFAGYAVGNSGTVVPYTKADLSTAPADDSCVRVANVWVKDSTTERVQLEDPDTGQPMFNPDGSPALVDRPKYPYGRNIVMAGDRIIADQPNPFWHGQWPYVEQDCYRVPGKFWCISSMQNLVSPQKERNKTAGLIIDNKNAMGNGQVIADRNCGLVEDDFTSQPGKVYFKTPGTDVHREPAPPLPNYILEFYAANRVAIDDILGMPPSSQGFKPPGIQSGVALQQLNNEVVTKLALLVRHLEDAMQKLGTQWVGLMRQYMTQSRMVRIVDKTTGNVMFQPLTPEQVRRDYEISVVPGSTLPSNKEFRQQQAIELLQLKVIDPEAALRYIEFPGAREILQRLEQQREMQMQLAMLQAQAAGGGASPGAPGAPPPTTGGPEMPPAGE